MTGASTRRGSRPIALTIAGSDSSGGAGIQADLKTFSALGVYGASVITALTAQNTMGVSAVQMSPAGFVAAQIDAVFADLAIDAIKTGMLGDAAVTTIVADALERRRQVPLVVDPVMVATSGDRLLDPAAIAIVKARLMPLATIVTPNLPEAAALLGCAEATSLDEMEAQARALLALGCAAVLIKGGHRRDGDQAVDVLVRAGAPRDLVAGPWIETGNTHGTGCTLASAITGHLAAGFPILDAVRSAKAFLTAALIAGRDLGVGRGAGPVDHLYAITPVACRTT